MPLSGFQRTLLVVPIMPVSATSDPPGALNREIVVDVGVYTVSVVSERVRFRGSGAHLGGRDKAKQSYT